ncbi:DUF3035 domain-containing protein [Rickettsiales endosymbiont of Peranema trichophorum]|uniref:DUF3035 domain-containing protein n=1 Tax=Rickettsiales endosymbiont of Peranema trichophorum TaxID=2486577 RepID=UPI0010230655|nr:DUF3035 domain-containing protein [Rickettsiales endosymbiont of Peranema trichophorum]RZI47300.1 DUF3035 domain-containing protein [Rickettsiales endosymbiont of Peranema trichophorum]
MQRVAIVVLCSLLVSGCSGVKSALGLKKPVPDEFTVISYPHLSVPPNFDLVDPSTQQNSALDASGHVPAGKTAYTQEEKNLMDQISSNMDTKSITEYTTTSKPQGIPFFGGQKGVLKPDEEQQRIEDNKKAGKQINHVDPSKKTEKSTLERIFGS